MLNVTIDWLREYLLRKFCVQVIFQNKRNRKRETPDWLRYALRGKYG